MLAFEYEIVTSFIFHARFTSFLTHAALLTFVICFFTLFHSCCSCARVFGKTFMREFLISYHHSEWYFLFSLFGARETKHAQQILLSALFLKWPFKSFNSNSHTQW